MYGRKEVHKMLSIQKISDEVAVVAKEFSISKAELFGSYANGTATEQSDVDLLVEFHPAKVTLLTLSRVKNRLEELLRVEVDVIHGPVPPDSILEIERTVSLYGS